MLLSVRIPQDCGPFGPQGRVHVYIVATVHDKQVNAGGEYRGFVTQVT